jgi:hypothetical protein
MANEVADETKEKETRDYGTVINIPKAAAELPPGAAPRAAAAVPQGAAAAPAKAAEEGEVPTAVVAAVVAAAAIKAVANTTTAANNNTAEAKGGATSTDGVVNVATKLSATSEAKIVSHCNGCTAVDHDIFALKKRDFPRYYFGKSYLSGNQEAPRKCVDCQNAFGYGVSVSSKDDYCNTKIHPVFECEQALLANKPCVYAVCGQCYSVKVEELKLKEEKKKNDDKENGGTGNKNNRTGRREAHVTDRMRQHQETLSQDSSNNNIDNAAKRGCPTKTKSSKKKRKRAAKSNGNSLEN